MEYINPLFKNSGITKPKTAAASPAKKISKPRALRSDKTHNIKFPVTPVTQMKLKSSFRLAKRIYQLQKRDELTQTKFNTLLLKYGLRHKSILDWNQEYQDTKTYMHTNILEIEYEREIGGPHGLTIQKNLSDRKVVYHIILSVLKWLERGGSLEEIIQQP